MSGIYKTAHKQSVVQGCGCVVVVQGTGSLSSALQSMLVEASPRKTAEATCPWPWQAATAAQPQKGTRHRWVQLHGEALLGEPLPSWQALARPSPARPLWQGQGLPSPGDPCPRAMSSPLDRRESGGTSPFVLPLTAG